MRGTGKGNGEQVVSRILFPAGVAPRRDNGHSSRPAVADGLEQPTRELRTGRPRALSYSVLLRVGFTEHPASPRDLVSSYLTVSPLPRPKARRFAFCGTVLLVTETGRYPAPCPAESGLSSRSLAEPATIRPAPRFPSSFGFSLPVSGFGASVVHFQPYPPTRR